MFRLGWTAFIILVPFLLGATQVPSPSTTNSYNYSENEHYGPIPKRSIDSSNRDSHDNAVIPQRKALPVGTERNNYSAPHEMARDDQHPFDLSVVGTVSTSPKRDWVDGIFLGFTGILAFGTYLQWLSYIRQHRPKLIVGYMVLVKAPDELITLDETTGRSRVAPLGVGLVIENRGGNRCHIIEGNTTIVVVGDNNIANLFTAPTLPAFDTGLGVPAYDKGHEAFKKTIIRAGAREYRVHSMSVSQSIHDQVNTYMAVHPDRGVDNLRLFVFGYLRYRAIWPSPVYTTAFCRRYDRNKQAFIPVRDPRYDYRD